jgi:hypothetical protein
MYNELSCLYANPILTHTLNEDQAELHIFLLQYVHLKNTDVT